MSLIALVDTDLLRCLAVGGAATSANEIRSRRAWIFLPDAFCK